MWKLHETFELRKPNKGTFVLYNFRGSGEMWARSLDTEGMISCGGHGSDTEDGVADLNSNKQRKEVGRDIRALSSCVGNGDWGFKSFSRYYVSTLTESGQTAKLVARLTYSNSCEKYQ